MNDNNDPNRSANLNNQNNQDTSNLSNTQNQPNTQYTNTQENFWENTPDFFSDNFNTQEFFSHNSEYYEAHNLNQNPLAPEDTATIAQPETEEDTLTEEELKKKKIIRICLIAGSVILAVLLIIYIWGCFYFTDHFIPGTVVNGVSVGRETVDEALNKLNSMYMNRSVQIIGKDGVKNQVTGKEIGLEFNNDKGELNDLVKEQNQFVWPFSVFLFRRERDFSTDYRYSENDLNAAVDNLTLVKGPGVTPPKDAAIRYNGTEYVIDPAQEGTQPNVDALKQAVLKALVDDSKTIDLSQDNLYVKPAVTQDSQVLQDELAQYNTAIKAVINITFPTQQITLDKQTFHSWLTVDNNNEVTVNDQSLNQFVADLANRFNTVGKNISFTTTSGTTLYFKDDDGWELNQTGEAQQLKQQILAGEEVTENPVWSQQGQNAVTGTSISGTYIEVSLDRQMVWFYKNNSLNTSSSIVSGDIRSGQGSYRGLYFLQSKNTNVNLFVRLPNGTSTNLEVQYWLPYSKNYGFQSASWRDQFGGSIYKTAGTNGDIDVPVDTARTLYNNADVGTPVLIY